MLRKLNFILKAIAIVAMASLLSSCSIFHKSIRIDEVNHSYPVLRQSALRSLPLGLRSSSSNGRELLSQYFLPDPKTKYRNAINDPIRLTAKIVLLGDRRPYRVEVYVLVEERVDRGGRISYRNKGQDLRIATEVKNDLQARLAQRREDLNIIDDFRVF